MEPTNLDINDAACLHVVHILQHPTSRPTTRSTQDRMVNDLKKNLYPLPAGKYGKTTKRSSRRRHQVNNGNSGLGPGRVRVLGVLRSVRSKRSSRRGQDGKCSLYVMKKKRTGSRIMWLERPQWQESEFKT